MDETHKTPFTWYEDFYNQRVLPKVCEDMEKGGCYGFFHYLVEHSPDLYNRIESAEEEIDSLWLNSSDKSSFRAACKKWYELLLEAKKGFESWKTRQRESEQQVGKQESMVMK